MVLFVDEALIRTKSKLMGIQTKVNFITSTYKSSFYNDTTANLPMFRVVSQLFRSLSAMVNLSMLSRCESATAATSMASIMERQLSQ